MDRNSGEYRKLKTAFELSLSTGWTEYLKPCLEAKAKEFTHQPLAGLDAALQYNERVGEMKLARNILNMVERDVKTFMNATVTNTESIPTDSAV